METTELIQKIHESNTYGIFVEIGTGMPVSEALFEVEGASKTIYSASSPYSKQSQELELGWGKYRSVSLESIEQALEKINVKEKANNVNTVFVSSFQLGTENTISHGWIGLMTNKSVLYYHITLTGYCIFNRKTFINCVKKIGLEILYAQNNLELLASICETGVVDIIENQHGESLIIETLKLKTPTRQTEFPITISSEGKLIRLEDLIRNKDLIIYKGSFNPIHNQHMVLLNAAKQNYSNAIPIFSISLNTYGKENINNEELLFRIKSINTLGYPVIIFDKPWFDSCAITLKTVRMHENKIIFLLGTDTINRLIESSFIYFKSEDYINSFKSLFKNIIFAYLRRPNYIVTPLIAKVSHFKCIGEDESAESSTEIRKLYKEGNISKIKQLIPADIYDLYINFMSNLKA
jgi:nicotinic acid mononucleotide adenylyltransferase